MHAPLVGVLGCGELRVTRPDGVTEYCYLAGGVVQVADDEVDDPRRVGPAHHRAGPGPGTGRAGRRLRRSPRRGDIELEVRLERMDDQRARIRVAERARIRGALTADQILDQPV